MFSKMRRRITYSNVTATVALLFAMTGGAYAAKRYIITSTKQISPAALKQLSGKVGPAGAAGPSGPQGSVGPAGANGKDGAPGGPGERGIQGVSGEKGETGVEGSPWTVGGKLPSGKSETGVWAYHGSKENKAVGDAPISFPLRVENTKKEPVKPEFVLAGKVGAHCTGSASEPTAPAGYLCVYDAVEEKPFGAEGTANQIGFGNGEEFPPSGTTAGREGVLVEFETVNIGTSPIPFALAEGTWIVTAE